MFTKYANRKASHPTEYLSHIIKSSYPENVKAIELHVTDVRMCAFQCKLRSPEGCVKFQYPVAGNFEYNCKVFIHGNY